MEDIYVDSTAMQGNIREVLRVAEDVFKELGPGHHEYVYDRALQAAFTREGFPYVSQPIIPVRYLGKTVSYVQPDFVVGGSIVLEIKVQLAIQPMHRLQAAKYLRVLNAPVVLIVNFPLVKTWKYTIAHDIIEDTDHPFFLYKHPLTGDLLGPFAEQVSSFAGMHLSSVNGEPTTRTSIEDFMREKDTVKV